MNAFGLILFVVPYAYFAVAVPKLTPLDDLYTILYVYSFTVHCAYNVTFDNCLFVWAAFTSYFVPFPSADVFHELNV